MPSPIHTVLVTGAGGPAGASLCRQLRARSPETQIIATDVREVNPPADVFRTGPQADSPELITFLSSVIADYSVDLLIPTVQEELPAVAAAAENLDTRVMVSGAAAVEVCQDKLLTAAHLESAGLGVPWTRVGPLSPVGYPLVVKPRVSRGGRGVTVVESPAHLPKLDHTVLMQGFAPGTEYCPQIYRSPVDDSVTTVVLEKTTLREGRVGNATAVLRLDRDQAPEIADLAEAATRKLDLYGPLDMDIRRDATGRPLVLEVNARFGANSAHAPEILSRLLADSGTRKPGVAHRMVAH